MNTTTVSSKGQVVLPKSIREALGIRAGSLLAVRVEGSRVVMEAQRTRWQPLNPAGVRLSRNDLCRPVDLEGHDGSDRG
ncbi:MAG: AbrB/MazE/SpoVT family DNA-binding domain-containing protein [Gammaproteobacteria bacterium]